MAGNSVIISVLADTKQFARGLDDATKSGASFGAGFKAVGLAAGAALLAVGAGTAAFLASSIQAAGESQKIAAQTAAVVQSTGMAAGKSAGQIGDLATKLSRLSGIDDEVIQGGENILLTFTNISGVNFDKATASALDMSTALGTDLQSSATLVGKALNDPVKGISALTRVGVTFSEGQKDQIANFVKMGDVASAQRVILAELNKEFGGSAAAFGNTYQGAIGKVKTEFGNLQEAIGGAFLPVITQVLGKASTLMANLGNSPAFQNILTGIAGFVSGLLDGNSAIGGFASTVAQLAGFFSPLGIVLKVLTPLLPQIGDAFQQVGSTILAALAPVLPVLVDALQSVVSALSGGLAAVLPVVVGVILTLVRALAPVIATVLPPLASLFSLVANIIATSVVPIIQQLAPVIGQLVEAFAPAIAAVLSLAGPLLTALMPVLKAILPPILALVQILVTTLSPILVVVADLISGLVTIIADSFGGALKIIGDLLSGNFAGALKDARALFSKVWGDIISMFSKVGDAIASGVQQIGAFFAGLGKQVLGAIVGADRWLIDTGRNLIQGLINGATSMLGNLASFVSGLANKYIIDPIKRALGIHSPSRVFAEIGGYTIQGLTLGLSDTTSVRSAVDSLGKELASTTLPAPRVSSLSVRPSQQAAADASSAAIVSQMTAADRAFFRELFAEFAGSLTVTDGVIASAASAAQARLVKAGAL